MAELVATTPCAGLLPVIHGDTTLSEVDPGPMVSLQPFKGQDSALDAALQSGLGCGLPKPGRSTSKAPAKVIWFGKDIHMCMGAYAPDDAEKFAAITNQSDGWAVVSLSGLQAEDVLARLVPVDLRGKSFKRGHVCRTMLQHINVSIQRTGENAFEIMAFRSMAGTLVHDIATAMKQVAGRTGISSD